MRQLFGQEQAEIVWREKAKDAIGRGDEDAHRLAIVNLRVLQTLWTARQENWSSWKSRAVCKYIRKTIENMAIVELALVNDQGIEELVDHAATGFDDFARRRAR